MSFCSDEFIYLNKVIRKNEANLKRNIFLGINQRSMDNRLSDLKVISEIK